MIRSRLAPQAIGSLTCGAVLFLFGCSSPPPIPEREVKSVTSAVPAAPTTQPIATKSNIAQANFEEPAPLQPLVTPTPPLPEVEPIIKPYDEWSDQQIAADALGRIGKDAVPALRQALQNSDPKIREQAADVLGRMGSDAKEAVPDLIPLLDDPHEEVRRAATRTLGRIGPDASEAVPALMKTLLTPEKK